MRGMVLSLASATVAEKAKMLIGFNSASSAIAGWGHLVAANGYSALYKANDSNGGALSFASKDGQISMQIDGLFYQNEGVDLVASNKNIPVCENTSSENLYTTTSLTDTFRKVYLRQYEPNQNLNVKILTGWSGLVTTGGNTSGAVSFVSSNVFTDVPVVIASVMQREGSSEYDAQCNTYNVTRSGFSYTVQSVNNGGYVMYIAIGV